MPPDIDPVYPRFLTLNNPGPIYETGYGAPEVFQVDIMKVPNNYGVGR